MKIWFYFLCMVFGMTHAQIMDLNVRAGYNASLTQNDGAKTSSIDYSMYSGYYLGGEVVYHIEDYFNNRVAVSMGINYVNHGFKYLSAQSGESDEYKTITINEFTLPILGYYSPIEPLMLSFGGYAGYVLNSRKIFKRNGNEQIIDFKPNIKTLDYGIIAGVRYYPWKDIGVELQYTMGLADLNEDLSAENLNDYLSGPTKVGGILLGLTYTIDQIGKKGW